MNRKKLIGDVSDGRLEARWESGLNVGWRTRCLQGGLKDDALIGIDLMTFRRSSVIMRCGMNIGKWDSSVYLSIICLFVCLSSPRYIDLWIPLKWVHLNHLVSQEELKKYVYFFEFLICSPIFHCLLYLNILYILQIQPFMLDLLCFLYWLCISVNPLA